MQTESWAPKLKRCLMARRDERMVLSGSLKEIISEEAEKAL